MNNELARVINLAHDLRLTLLRLLLPVCCLLLSACEPSPSGQRVSSPAADATSLITSDDPITPIPTDLPFDADKVALGRALFADRRLSRDDSISCAHCHPLERYGMDGLARSVGIDGREGKMNAPTVFNSRFNFRQFWDGRATSLEEQVDGPLTHPNEMGSNWPEVLAKLNADTGLVTMAKQAFGKTLDADVVRSALAEFQRTLITPDAPFDRYLRGEEQAISDQAREGWRLFRDLGCISCHQGVNIGGNMYSRLGQFDSYFTHREPEQADFGRYNITGEEDDRFRFKVPSLRNVARTAPYFHDGGVATLPEAVERIARSQLGVQLSPAERVLIVEFLESLTAPLPAPAP